MGAEICKKSRRGIDKPLARLRGGRGYAQRPRPGDERSTFEVVPLRKGSTINGLGVPGTVGIVRAVEVTAQEASEASARFFAGRSVMHHPSGQRKRPVGWRSPRGAVSFIGLLVVVNGSTRRRTIAWRFLRLSSSMSGSSGRGSSCGKRLPPVVLRYRPNLCRSAWERSSSSLRSPGTLR